jgi:hypothetical protein
MRVEGFRLLLQISDILLVIVNRQWPSWMSFRIPLTFTINTGAMHKVTPLDERLIRSTMAAWPGDVLSPAGTYSIVCESA